MTYKKEIIRSMKLIAKKNNAIFLGQSVAVPGNLLFSSLKDIPQNKKLELPIFEETQMGMSIGLALNGYLPVTCYPRFDFFILSLNQTINHLDKIQKLSSGEFNPFVIVRVLVGSKKPIDAGLQHTMDYSEELKRMLKFINVIQLKDEKKIFNSYKKVLKEKISTVFIEYDL
tara:strand:- start:45 stop:560 length:516 start_codon:yes stop_codon:yes gene_type:complete